MKRTQDTAWQRSELFYCSNVHGGEDWGEVSYQLQHYISEVRDKRGLKTMAAGLWFPAELARSLVAAQDRCSPLNVALIQHGLELFSLNGFPYCGFHDEVVKQQVYSPDWSATQRYDYTLDLAFLLADCLPANYAGEATISSLPLGFAKQWNNDKQQTATMALCCFAEKLAQLHKKTGCSIRLCLEMEPECVLETTDQAIDFFCNQLPATAKAAGIDIALINRHLGICFDVCHQAVMFEDPWDSLQKLKNAGIIVGKIQISSALEVNTVEQLPTLKNFDEPRYLHQVRMRHDDGSVSGVMDLPDVLLDDGKWPNFPWRIHFHLPVQLDAVAVDSVMISYAPATTQQAILRTLDYLAANDDFKPHLEIETYTWDVLPVDLRPRDDATLIAGLAAELDWLEQAMQQRGLLECEV